MTQTQRALEQANPHAIIARAGIRATVPLLAAWQRILMPTISDTVDEMIAAGNLPLELAEAFDDFGHFCQRISAEMMEARTRLGLPLPEGPDDA